MVRKVAGQWDDLCIALELSYDFQECLERDEQSCYNRLKKVVIEWLKGNGAESSWKYLCGVFRGKLVENQALAEEIEKKYM
jgi:hypothetical protein